MLYTITLDWTRTHTETHELAYKHRCTATLLRLIGGSGGSGDRPEYEFIGGVQTLSTLVVDYCCGDEEQAADLFRLAQPLI